EFKGKGDLSVVVAFDVRIFKDMLGTYKFLSHNPLLDLSSRKLAVIAGEIYAAHGIRCYFVDMSRPDIYLSTPELSFSLRLLKAHGGVNMSASHNHPDDNGFKFYNVHGAQDIPPYDEALAEYMNQFEPVTRMPFDEAERKGLVTTLPAEVHEKYLLMNLALKRGLHPPQKVQPRPITYTPLCGTGRTTVEEVLRRAGHNVVVHEPQAAFDGTFPGIPFHLPNPEVPEAAWPAIETARACGSSVVFSTDPDADRIGVLAKDAAGRWRHLTGNEIACLLTYYMLLDKKRGPAHRTGFMIKTIVTSSLVERIAVKAGRPIVSDLLIGFKYIADVLRSLEAEGRYEGLHAKAPDLILAVEESHGYLLTDTIRDKDAAGPALMLADLVCALDAEGKTLVEYLDEVARNAGSFGNGARALLMRGIRGSDMLQGMMASLRESPPAEIGAWKVTQFNDFQKRLREQPDFDPESSMAKSNDLLEFRTPTGRAIVRPSGTEPKIKIYSEAEAPGGTREDAKRDADLLALEMYRVCLRRLGPEFEFSTAAERIPDHISLDVKRQFNSEFPGEFLKRAPELGRLDGEKLLDALREMLKKYVEEGDPLPVFRQAIIELCRSKPDADLAAIRGMLEK
ncbi:MAG: hypothetical protein NTZ09_06275, partial [Candidatus Hydrogenedentes bacterium]|nr:hypothetical protein [Candidatus Hydrogenedentota bacterium]